MLSFATPLRYPGGKGRLGEWFSKLIEINELRNCHFIEPYAGGAGSAIYLLTQEKVEQITINDSDPIVHSIWWALVNDGDRFIDMIENAELTIDEWYKQRAIVQNNNTDDITKLGFAAFYQNRTNRSGIIKGGVIGGIAQEGKYKLDARFNKNSLIKRVRRIQSLSDRITIRCEDGIKLMANNGKIFDKKTLIYIDPPYYNKGSQLYKNYYNPDDHRHVADVVKHLNCPWITTYDNCPEIVNLYSGEKTQEFSFSYSTHTSRPKGKEVCFSGNLKKIPKIYLKR
ncbi:DNA adenine methylase [bacterium Scap17]|nr:DNA adenine methylase [bacterium Scap17]